MKNKPVTPRGGHSACIAANNGIANTLLSPSLQLTPRTKKFTPPRAPSSHRANRYNPTSPVADAPQVTLTPHILAITAGIATSILLLWLLAVVTTVANAAYGARRAWNDLGDTLDSRRAIIPKLTEQIDQRFSYDPDILRPVTLLKTVNPDDEPAVRKVRREVDHCETVVVLVQRITQYQALLDGTELTTLCTELLEANDNVANVASRYNQIATEFNRCRREFAMNVVTRAFSATDMPLIPLPVASVTQNEPVSGTEVGKDATI